MSPDAVSVPARMSMGSAASHMAKPNSYDAYAYLKGVLTRPPTQPASEIGELVPHRWQPAWFRKTEYPIAYRHSF